ncbi:hypothetical protein PIB30_054572 [Stylosanthes scabra]|uniref:Uncharacterized protein n=1 Tax=Stylosanthes scabra TaxID=79078 RepID=A0ABU6ULS9_9FABA|nr:hypothetical protein [Stylosanthes scabra]
MLRTSAIEIDYEKRMFKRAFALFIEKSFLCPASSANISPKHLLVIRDIENTQTRNWAHHVNNFLVNRITEFKEKERKAVKGCHFVLMIIYFKERYFGKTMEKRETRPPWTAYWTGDELRKKIGLEVSEPTNLKKKDHNQNLEQNLMFRNQNSHKDNKGGINTVIEDVARTEIEAQIQACKEAQAHITEPEPDKNVVMQAYKVVERIIEARIAYLNEDDAEIQACEEIEAKIDELNKNEAENKASEEDGAGIGDLKEDKESSDNNKLEKPPQKGIDDFDRPSFDLGIDDPTQKEHVQKQSIVELYDLDEFLEDQSPETPAVLVTKK